MREFITEPGEDVVTATTFVVTLRAKTQAAGVWFQYAREFTPTYHNYATEQEAYDAAVDWAQAVHGAGTFTTSTHHVCAVDRDSIEVTRHDMFTRTDHMRRETGVWVPAT